MKAKVFFTGAASVVVIIILATVWSTVSKPNGLWAIHEITYKSAINSLPPPDGWDPKTDRVFSTPDYPRAERLYDVRGGYDEIVALVMKTVPQLGWSYLGDQTNSPGTISFFQQLYFDNTKNQCLRIEVRSQRDQAVELQDKPTTVQVHIHLMSKVGGPSPSASSINFCEDYEGAP
jgi:hypothetical protein